MRKILTLAAIAAIGGAIEPAMADNIKPSCGGDPQVVSISKDEMKAKISDLGYEVRQLKVDDGCFEALLFEPRSGGAVKATFSAATGELIRARLSS